MAARRYDPAPDAPRVHVSLPSEATAPGIGRRSVHAIESYADPAIVDDVKLLVSELVTNSVRHSDAKPGERIDLTVEVLPETVVVSVRDPGRGFEHEPRARDQRASGWGLFLIDELSDRWGIDTMPDDGTSVWFEIRRHGTPSQLASPG